MRHYLACDLGAESGRLMLGQISGDELKMEEIHRFANTPFRKAGSLQWDIDGLFSELKSGLRKAAQLNLRFEGFSCDSWGVDYVLFDAKGRWMAPAFHYRDERAARGASRALELVTWPEIFAETGIQYMPINTIFQLAAEEPVRLASADRILLIADAIHFLLSGEAKAEETLASTSQLYNPITRHWSAELIRRLGFPARLFPPITPPGSRIGHLQDSIRFEMGLPELPILASCSHDTAAAVVGVPASGTHWAYISSGTWSLLGVELPRPALTESCRELNFTNETGCGGTVRLLKNIVGLWILQECRREWAQASPDLNYARLTEMAAHEPAFISLINSADVRFVAPGDMPGKIEAFCRETQQPVPRSPGPVVRAVLESLALLYRRTLKQVERIVGSRIERLHIVGGGSKNDLLNQWTANACQIPVVAGPVEATAAGNIVVQAIALGHLPDVNQARNLIGSSFPPRLFQPADRQEWSVAIERFEKFF